MAKHQIKKRILLIDDEAGFAALLRLNLEKTGDYEVQIENKGSKGFSAAQNFRPDLILLDVIMPDMDGGSVAALLKTDEALREIPIIFLTAILSTEESHVLGGTLAGYPCIPKPVSPEEVIALIEECLLKNEQRG